MKYQPQELPEDINVTPVNPLVNFFYLLGTVAIFSGVIYLILGAIATQLAIRISPDLESKIGKQILATTPTVATVENSPQREYLNELLSSLIEPDCDRCELLTVHIQEHPYPNAIIIPGGHIIFTTAFLAEAESVNEIAFVMAHEIGHHVHRDTLKGLGRSLVFLTIASAIGIGRGNSDFVTLTGAIGDLHYSRQQESAADLYALNRIIELYGHGNASLDFFQRIQTENKDNRGKLSAYFSTHPLTQSRIDLLNQVANNNGWQMTGQITQLPAGLFSSQDE